jgi:hypothetical protein
VSPAPPAQGSRRLADQRRHQPTDHQLDQPHRHTNRRRPRQTAPPQAWIRTAGTTIAEQLDHIATISALTTPTSAAATIAQHQADPNPTDTDPADPEAPADGDAPTDNAGPTGTDPGSAQAVPETGQTSRLEDRLTDALLRHCLANPPLTEYQPDQDPAGDQATTPGPTRATEDDAEHADDLDDDPPPF